MFYYEHTQSIKGARSDFEERGWIVLGVIIASYTNLLMLLLLLGTILTPEDYLNNKEWVKRIETLFNVVDSDKDGFVTVNDLVINVKKYSHFHSDPKVIENFRVAQTEFAAELGIKPGISVTKEEYVSAYAKLAPGEVAKVRSGEGSVLHKMLNKVFDLIDTTHDGTVSRERYRDLAIASEVWNPKFVDSHYEIMDTNKNGKLERKEISDYQYRITFTLEDVTGNAKVFDALKSV